MNAFLHDKRGSMTPQRRARIFQLREGKCHECTRKLYPGDFYVVEHLLEDHAAAGHIRRAATKHCVPKAFRKRPWR